MNVSDAKRALSGLVLPHLIEDGCLPEADNEINDASRNVIKAMQNEHGEAWLGNINLHEYHKGEDEPVIWKWHGGLIRNFAVSFVVPKYDTELEKLIIDRADAEYKGTSEDYGCVNTIMNKIESLGGIHLSWT
jgi:hypothetical protein